MSTEAPGISGALQRAKARASQSLSRHDVWAIRLVFIAGIATILHKAGVIVPGYAVLFAVALGVAALLYEMNATTFALRAFWNGRPLSAAGWSFIWLVAFAYSMNQWVGAASENEGAKTNVHQTAYTASINASDNLVKAKKEVDRLQTRLSWMDTAVNGNPVRSVDAAQADLDNAKANRFWTMTNECKETKRPQTRQFCANVAAWKSEKSLASERLTLKTELEEAKAVHAAALQASGSTKTETSSARTDMLMLTKYAGMKQEDAQALTAVSSVVAISIFLSFATLLKELENLRAQGPRTKLFSLKGFFARLRYKWDGKAPNGTTILVDDELSKETHARLAQLKRQLGHRAEATA